MILLALLCAIPLAGLLAYSVFEHRRLTIAEVQRAALNYANEIANSHAQIVDGARQLLIGLAQLPEVLDHNPGTCNTRFATILQRLPLYTVLAAAKPNGDVFCSGLPLKQPVNISDRPYFQESMQERDLAVSRYQIGRISGNATIAVSYPSVDTSGRVRAVIFLGLDFGWFDRVIAQMSLPTGTAVTLINQEGMILYRHPDSEQWVGKPAGDPLAKPDKLLAREGLVAEGVGMDGEPRLFAFSIVRGMPDSRAPIVRVGIPSAWAFAEVNRIARRDVAVVGLILLLALIAAGLTAERSVIRPAHALMKAAVRLATGDLRARTGLPHNGGELGQLAKSFDSMAEALKTEEAKQAQAQEALKASEERYRSVAESATEAIIVSDKTGTILTWNKGAQETFGYAEEEVRGKPLTLLMPQRYHEAHRQGLERLRSGGNPRVIGSTRELEGLRKNGSEFPIELSLSSWDTKEGTFFSGIVRDIAERKQAEEDIRLSLERVRALHEIDVAMTSTLDLKGVLDVLLEKIDLTLPYSATTIRLFNKESGLLEPAACRNLDEQEWKTEKWKPGRGLANAVFEAKAPVVILDAQTDPRVRDPEFYRKHRLVSYLGTPLTAKGEHLGVLSFYTKERHEFDNNEIEFL
ncbi:MAG: PAS domain S-box protein, partial [Deltaproteobacteria bacterium]|nr:PAS domain S-box protein [Deltaproteobacteria bacterium]